MLHHPLHSSFTLPAFFWTFPLFDPPWTILVCMCHPVNALTDITFLPKMSLYRLSGRKNYCIISTITDQALGYLQMHSTLEHKQILILHQVIRSWSLCHFLRIPSLIQVDFKDKGQEKKKSTSQHHSEELDRVSHLSHIYHLSQGLYISSLFLPSMLSAFLQPAWWEYFGKSPGHRCNLWFEMF